MKRFTFYLSLILVISVFRELSVDNRISEEKVTKDNGQPINGSR